MERCDFVENKEKSKICKVVCFDEESSTDYLQILCEGKMEKTMELLDSNNKSGELEGKIGISKIFKALINIEGNASIKTSFNSDKMVKNIVKNTILSDFIKMVESQPDSNDRIIKNFKGYKISAVKDSLAHMVMITPYLNILKDDSVIQTGELNISVVKLDEVLRSAKGYYEFLGKKDENEIIFRFNINSFRNGYTISDLLKMDLYIWAIKVGKTKLDNLNINKEFDIDSFVSTHNSSDNPSYEGGKEEDINSKQLDIEEQSDKKKELEELEVFDVLLAGVTG
ncbi:DUF6414 family protein [Candidatus Arthromitus sp. SFB-turkey]|uniref:DUF6414 family protein n=1 Tax=Candidatus Arthromitus sp. SFB-turkey TaxID=1840217 RepID=UPI0007F44B41|nr:DUF6414 family protein [Candidatus Arthromitus sp. SFB-turkey]OAT87596.1 hypothetical protein A6P36_04110 [Candidatus Arthromitus sp. SFB-turkey]